MQSVYVGFLFKFYSLITACFLWRKNTQRNTVSSLARYEQLRNFIVAYAKGENV